MILHDEFCNSLSFDNEAGFLIFFLLEKNYYNIIIYINILYININLFINI